LEVVRLELGRGTPKIDLSSEREGPKNSDAFWTCWVRRLSPQVQ